MAKQSERNDWDQVWQALALAIRDDMLVDNEKKLRGRSRIQAFVSPVLSEAARSKNLRASLDDAASGRRQPTDETLRLMCEAFNRTLGLIPPLQPHCLRTAAKDQLLRRLGISPEFASELFLQPGKAEFFLGQDFAAVDIHVPQGYALEAMVEIMLQPFRSIDGRYEFGTSEAMIVVRLEGTPTGRIDPLIEDVELPREAPRWRVKRDGVRNSAVWRVTSLAKGSVTGLCNFDTPLLKALDVTCDDRLIAELRIDRNAQSLVSLSDAKAPSKAKKEMIEALFRKAQRDAGAHVSTDIGPVHIVLARVEATVCERPVYGER